MRRWSFISWARSAPKMSEKVELSFYRHSSGKAIGHAAMPSLSAQKSPTVGILLSQEPGQTAARTMPRCHRGSQAPPGEPCSPKRCQESIGVGTNPILLQDPASRESFRKPFRKPFSHKQLPCRLPETSESPRCAWLLLCPSCCGHWHSGQSTKKSNIK